MVYAQIRISATEQHAWISLGFKIQIDHLIPARRPNFIIIQKDKRI